MKDVVLGLLISGPVERVQIVEFLIFLQQVPNVAVAII